MVYFILGAVITLLVSLIFYLIGNKRSIPVYGRSEEYVYAMKDRHNDHLKILWDNEIVTNVRSIKLTFWNKGRKLIRKTDISGTSPIAVQCKNIRSFDIKN